MRRFCAVPDAALAREHLRRLTAAPHWASSPEDYATASVRGGAVSGGGSADGACAVQRVDESAGVDPGGGVRRRRGNDLHRAFRGARGTG